MLIDSHCHLHDREFFTSEQAEEMLSRAKERGVKKIICIGTSHDDSLAAAEFAAAHDNVYWTYGIHPEVAGQTAKPVFSSAGLESASTSYTGAPAEPSLRDEPVGPVRNIRLGLPNRKMSMKKTSSATPAFPILALVISGGHTQILYMPAHNQFEIIGTTRDDAVGECFDKVAKILGLPYPGGPSIAKAALEGDALKYRFPHPKVEGLDFSFSGLKTAVLRTVQKELGLPISHPSHDLKNHLSPEQVRDFAAAFQRTAVEILVEKLKKALKEHPEVKSVVIAGGVSANKVLREALPEAYFPTPALSGDNGAMVAAACYYEIQSGVKPTDPYSLNIYPRVEIR